MLLFEKLGVIVVLKSGGVIIIKILLLLLYYLVQNYGYCFYLILCIIFGELYVKFFKCKEIILGYGIMMMYHIHVCMYVCDGGVHIFS